MIPQTTTETATRIKKRLSYQDRRQLVETYAPILVLFPEKKELGRPHGGRPDAPEVRGDFHPRPVDIVLDHAYLYPGIRWNLKHPRAFFKLDQSNPLIRHMPEFVRQRFPEPAANAREMLSKIVRGDPDIALASVLDLVGVGRGPTAPDRAWDRYFQILEQDKTDRYHPRIYARVMQGDEVIEWTLLDRLRWYSRLLTMVDETIRKTASPLAKIADEMEFLLEEVEQSFQELVTGFKRIEGNPHHVAVQFWFLYYYNDWHNKHEADWEGCTLILRGRPDQPVTPENLQPEIVGYSSHVSGRRRPWVNIERHETHPVIYCARGSHASYFEAREQGYVAGLPISIKIPWINLTIATQIRQGSLGFRDWVAKRANVPTGASILYPQRDYEIQLLPNIDPRKQQYNREEIDSLSWLVFPGLWGDRPLFSIGGSGPKGPLWQGLKSDNPFEWVRRQCAPDDGYSP